MNANDATLTQLATAQSGSTVADDAPNAPASGGFDLILEAVAGSALGSSGAPYTLTVSAIDLTTVTQPWPPQILHQAFDAASLWHGQAGLGPRVATGTHDRASTARADLCQHGRCAAGQRRPSGW